MESVDIYEVSSKEIVDMYGVSLDFAETMLIENDMELERAKVAVENYIFMLSMIKNKNK